VWKSPLHPLAASYAAFTPKALRIFRSSISHGKSMQRKMCTTLIGSRNSASCTFFAKVSRISCHSRCPAKMCVNRNRCRLCSARHHWHRAVVESNCCSCSSSAGSGSYSDVVGESHRAVWAYGWCHEPKHEGVRCSDACGMSSANMKQN